MSDQKDNYGNTFQTPDGKPVTTYNVPVQIYTPTGLVPGTHNGTQAIPDKK